MGIWNIIFTTPEDEQWHLVSNGHRFGLHHECLLSDENPMVQIEKNCRYCGSIPPDALWGMCKLADWDR